MNTEEALNHAERLLAPWTLEATRPEKHRLHVLIEVASLIPAVSMLADACWGNFGAITGSETGQAGPLELLYYFFAGASVLTLGFPVHRTKSKVSSISYVFPAAASYERQLSETWEVEIVDLSEVHRPGDTETMPDHSPPYKQWVQSILNREPDAWTQLHEFYSARLRHDIQISLRTAGLGLELVDDIEQDTWLTGFARISDFEWIDEERFYYWLRVISCNHVHTYRRKQNRYRSVDDNFEEDNSNQDDFFDRFVWDNEALEDQVIRLERLEALDQVMRTLPQRDRVILMRRLMGETPGELALEYRLKPEHVRTLLDRAKKKIKGLLPPSLLEDDSDE